MGFIKEYREFFLRHVQVPSGAKADQEAGYPLQYIITGVGSKFNRLLKGDFPSEGVFKKLCESITFKLNVEDTATTTTQGLTRIATDVEAIDRTDNIGVTFENVVKPHQLPNIVLTTDVNDTVIGTPQEIGGLKLSIITRLISGKSWKNFKVEVNPNKSIIIEPTTKKLELDGDSATPGNDLMYGTSATGVKGWRSFAIYIANIATTVATSVVGSLVPAYTFNSSVKLNILNIELDGDNATPGNDKVYRTDGAGAKGWGNFPTVSAYLETLIAYITLSNGTLPFLQLTNQSTAELTFFKKYPIINTAILNGYCATPNSPIDFKLNDKDGNLLETVSSNSGNDASGMFRIVLPIPNTHDNLHCSFEINSISLNLVKFYGIELAKV